MSRHVVVDARLANGGGIGTYLRNVLPAVAALRPDWRFTVFLDGDGDDAGSAASTWARGPNMATTSCRARVYSLREQWELRDRCPRDADLFWTPHYNIPLALERRVRLAATIHDVMHLTRPEYRRSIAKRAYARTMFRLVRDRAALILFDSAFTERSFQRHVGTPRGATQVAHLGVSDAWRSAPTADPRSASRSGHPYIVFVGALKPHKNLRGLVDAFRQIVDRVPHDLVIIGGSEGLITADTGLTAATADLGSRVVLAGEVSKRELHAWVAHADLLVQPSFDEGFGLPPLEAMAAGCPCLVSRAGSLPEVCGEAAAYCDPSDTTSIADGIFKLLTDAGQRQVLIERGREHSARFRWSDAAATTARGLDAVLVR